MSEFTETAENISANAAEADSTNADGLEDKSKETKVNEKADGTPNPDDIPDAPRAQDSRDDHDATGDDSEADAPSESENDMKDGEEQKKEGETDMDGLEDKSKEAEASEKEAGTPDPNDVPDAPNTQYSCDGDDATDDNSEADTPSEQNDMKDGEEQKNEGLTDAEKQQIKNETGWSDEIIDHIESMAQYEIYKKAGLCEKVVNGKVCLVKKDIDWDYVDPKTGKTNKQLAAEGKSPIDSKTGEKIELHHMGQDQNGPFVELAENSEHGDGNHGTLHPNGGESWRHEPGAKSQYNQERAGHWKDRAENAEGGN